MLFNVKCSVEEEISATAELIGVMGGSAELGNQFLQTQAHADNLLQPSNINESVPVLIVALYAPSSPAPRAALVHRLYFHDAAACVTPVSIFVPGFAVQDAAGAACGAEACGKAGLSPAGISQTCFERQLGSPARSRKVQPLRLRCPRARRDALLGSRSCPAWIVSLL